MFDYLSLSFFLLLLLGCCHLPSGGVNHVEGNTNVTSGVSIRDTSDSSFATAVVNTQILTIFDYHGSQVYIYSALSNENENKGTPQKWIFYYVPVMAPTITSTGEDSQWIWLANNEIRLKLMLGNQEVQELARQAIMQKYDLSTAENSKYWTVAPLMIDLLMAYIVSGTTSPVHSVHPFRVVHPNSLVLTFRFQCSDSENARLIREKVINGDYEIEVAFYFAGFKQVTTNFVSITSDQLKSVLSKTTADGGKTNALYIHRNQAGKFIGNYVTNVKKMIYMESTNANMSLLTSDLQEQFISLLQQGMNTAEQIVLDAKLFDQVWSSSDLNPDRLTSELTKLFTHNETETKRKNDTNIYFNLNKQRLQSSSENESNNGNANVSFLGLSFGGGGGTSFSSSNSLHNMLIQTNHDIYSLDEIQRFLTQQESEFQWTGEKFIPKSFNVYKLTDLTDHLQVAIIAKQLIADRTQGAMIRTISTLNTETVLPTKPVSTFLTGTIQLYSSDSQPPLPWLLCNGSAVSRTKYKHLFSLIGEKFGAGDGITTFNLPDFRGRFAMGTDTSAAVNSNAGTVGLNGGVDSIQLTVEQLPQHTHNSGSFYAVDGGHHSHSYDDPGHDHGGETVMPPSNPWGRSHDHTIARDTTHITIHGGGIHWHDVEGQSGHMGSGHAIRILPPYQTNNYIIYSN